MYTDNFSEKELEILRKAVHAAELKEARTVVHDSTVKKIMTIVETFLRKKKLVCYGGTAINNILPNKDKFYDKDIDLPDYDFFSSNAVNDAKQLADLYYKKGYREIEAKAGVHHGTYKVFVNFIPIADITYIPKELETAIAKSALVRNGIRYAPPDYLRMAMYLELSRPKGDVSRWEKVLKRLTLLNKNFPMKNPRCNHLNFVREFVGTNPNKIYNIIKQASINQGLVFFGGYASQQYSKYMPSFKNLKNHPDFDILSETPKLSADLIKESLEDNGIKDISIIKHKAFGEIISVHYEIIVGKDTVAFLYKPLACHSYNTIKINKQYVRIATIDTMLSFYLAFLYANRKYHDKDRIYCMSQYLFTVQIKNRLRQKGPLKRFSLNCIGEQTTLTDIRLEKKNMYDKLKSDRENPVYKEWFLKYIPTEKTVSKKNIKTLSTSLRKSRKSRKSHKSRKKH